MPSETVGFIGLGIMGRPMALNLMKAGYKLVVTSRSQGPIDALAAAGAKAVKTPADVAREADVVVTMVPDTPDVEDVLFAPKGVAEGLKPGTLVIDMSSISPIETKRFAKKINTLGCDYLDAPVAALLQGLEEVPTDPPEPVNANSNGHSTSLRSVRRS